MNTKRTLPARLAALLVCLCLCAPGALAQAPALDTVIAYCNVYPSRPGERVPLYAQPSEDAQVLCEYYSSVMVTVHDISGEWALVCTGVESSNRALWGYMKTNQIAGNMALDEIPWEIPVARLRDESGMVALYSAPGDGILTARLPAGALVDVLGQSDAWSHINTGEISAFVRNEQLELTDQRVRDGDREVRIWEHGYGVLTEAAGGGVPVYRTPNENGQQIVYQDQGAMFQILADCGEWTQVRIYTEWTTGYVKTELLEIWWTEEMLAPRGTSVAAGEYAVGEELQAGLYTCHGEAVLELTMPGVGQKVYRVPAGAAYTVYLPAGMQVKLEGAGTLAGAAGERRIDRKNTYFSGSGRFLAGVEIQGQEIGGYELSVADGAQAGYYTISTLADEDILGGAAVRVKVEPGQAVTINVSRGEFLEIENLTVNLLPGNG